ncbi:MULTISPECIES: NAD(P)H-flavin reductase [unclassified Vibrio]|uniref:NAD(P)H-flavin reductase n=1 Tax=Vibrio sp. HB236076 TaxID=3232307 RepID=A0AB39HFC8_9VIBR|nr:NAD(P)H-flavin reductase [Vibrio sp. HB161653]MDP5255802.1 NAD(P)H-flavin reductase [Vibrio sp. HB161653]
MTIECKVKSISPLASNTYHIVLKPSEHIEFVAGQYLMVVMGDKDKRPFSIANSPQSSGELELHIGAAEHSSYAFEVVEQIRHAHANDGVITIDVPHGKAGFQTPSEDRGVLLIAGGTGFSYVRSILDYCIEQQLPNPIYLYWGGRNREQLYQYKALTDLSAQYDNVQFKPVVEIATDDWQGHVGNVLEAVAQDFESLEKMDIYIAGRFEMAGAARSQFTEQKAAKIDRMFADAYAFI